MNQILLPSTDVETIDSNKPMISGLDFILDYQVLSSHTDTLQVMYAKTFIGTKAKCKRTLLTA